LFLFCVTGCAQSPSPSTVVLPGAIPLALATDGTAAWFANGVAANGHGFLIGTLEPNSQVRQFIAMPGGMSRGIAVQGNHVWFSIDRSDALDGPTSDAIGSLDTQAHVVHIFATHRWNAWPEGMAIAPDGSLVVAESNTNAIGVLKNGRLVDRPLRVGAPGEFGGPETVTVTSDGTIYFSLAKNGRIGSLGTDGTWTFLPTPKPAKGAAPLTSVGKTAWFVDNGSIDELRLSAGRLTIRRHKLPWPKVQPLAIAADDQRVCFSTNPSGLGCYNLRAGTFARYPQARSEVAISVSLSGDRLWYGLGCIRNNPCAGAIGVAGL
jgi:streptogramin lyase